MNCVLIVGMGNVGQRYSRRLADCVRWCVDVTDHDYRGVENTIDSFILDLGVTHKPMGDGYLVLPSGRAGKGVVICTPTESHAEWAEAAHRARLPFLVEKPFGLGEAIFALNGCIVNNWSFVFPGEYLEPGTCDIEYDFETTGPHGLLWDCIQLIWLGGPTRHVALGNTSKTFFCKINGRPVTQQMVMSSYRRMLDAFVNEDANNLLDLYRTEPAHRLCRALSGTYPADYRGSIPITPNTWRQYGLAV